MPMDSALTYWWPRPILFQHCFLECLLMVTIANPAVIDAAVDLYRVAHLSRR